MTDDRPGADWAAALRRLPPGSAAIVRHTDADGRRRLARALRTAADARGVLLLVSAEDPATAADADGIHIPERALRRWRRVDLARRGPALLTASAHSMAALARASRLGVDAVLLSPVFATKSHPGGRALGLMRFEAMARRSPVPVFALGGVDDRSVRRIARGAGQGIAGIGLFLDPDFARKSGGFRTIGV